MKPGFLPQAQDFFFAHFYDSLWVICPLGGEAAADGFGLSFFQ
jgi:hypothetical protein